MSTRKISTKLAVEGESEYKEAMASCNAEIKTLKSNLALTESTFKGNANSMEALTAKGKALSSIYEAQQKKVATLENALKNAQKAQENYSTRVSTAKDNIQRCEKALSDLADSTGDTSEEQKALTEELNKWNDELEDAQAGETAAEKGVQNWQKQLNYAKVDLNNLSDEVQKNDQYLDEAAESADGCASSINEFGKEAKDAGDESEDFGGKAGDAMDQLANVLTTAGISAAVEEIGEKLLECAEAASVFESSIAKVSTIADTTEVPLEELESQIISLSGETGIAASSIAEATYSAISASVDTAQSVEFVQKATQLAAGGFTEAETAVDVLTTALNAYGLSAQETENISDILITTQNLGKTTVDELAQSVGKVIPLAAAYNVEMDNLGAAYAVLTANGVATAEAGTYLKAMLSELGDSGSDVAAILKQQTGKSFAGLMASGKSLGDVLAILGNSVGGDTTAFNELWHSSEAGIGALSILSKGTEGYNSVLDSMQNSAGATSVAYDKMASTSEFAQQRMQTAMENMKVAIGTQLNPALSSLYDTGTSAFNWATEFVTQNPWIVSAISALTIGIGTLTVGIAGATAAVAAWNAVMAVNPTILVAAGVTALVAAIGTFIVSTTSADDETKEFTASLQESKTAYDDLTASMAEEQQTTESMVAALETALEAEDKSAAQKSVILDMVAQLNEAIPELGLAYDEATDSINMTTESLDALVEHAAAQEEYEAQVARLSELYTEQADIQARLTEAQEAVNEAQEQGSLHMGKLKSNVDELTDALEENQAQIKKLEEESKEYGEWQAASEKATKEMQATVDDLCSEMQNLQEKYEESYEDAKKSIDSQLGLFQKLDGSAKTSINDLINSLKGQCDYMNEYAANIKKAMELGVDRGLIQKLSDGSEQSAQILASIVQGGKGDIEELNRQLARVEEGKADFADTVASMETDFDRRMKSIEDRTKRAAKNLNASAEAKGSGMQTIRGYIQGAEQMRGQLVAKYRSLAQSANRAYNSTIMHTSSGGGGHRGSHATGLDYVPYDNYSANLHRGEMVLTAAEASAMRDFRKVPQFHKQAQQKSPFPSVAASGHAGNSSAVNIHIEHMEVRDDQDIDRIAQELYQLTSREKRSRGGAVL